MRIVYLDPMANLSRENITAKKSAIRLERGLRPVTTHTPTSE